MARKIMAAVMWAARNLRQLAALGALLLAIRFAWLAGADALKQIYARLLPETSGQEDEKDAAAAPNDNPLTGLAKKVRSADNPHRPDLQQLDEESQKKPLELGAQPETSPAPETLAPVRLRRLLVDVGPGRSEVFVQGRKVGHTPYVGQINCSEGQPIRIEILPPQGAPVARSAICRGEIILANQ